MNPIKKLITDKEKAGFKFMPDRQFFKKVKIGQKRFWMIVRQEVDPTVPELKAIADHFGVNFLDLIPEENVTA